MHLPQRKTIRQQGYDYTSSGMYFITICTKNREPSFGKIKNKQMILNQLGTYVWQCWNDIPKHFGFVEIDEFICMPDHVHGILIIRRDATTARPINTPEHPNMIATTARPINIPEHPNMIATTARPINTPEHPNMIATTARRKDMIMACPDNKTICPGNISHNDRTARNAVPTNVHLQYGSVGYIINQFKGTITKFAKQNNIPFTRQSRFHDRIIRDENEFQNIRIYIKKNPENRENDNFR